jgi:MFS family permease
MKMAHCGQLNRNLRNIYAAALLRSTGVGLTDVLLGVYLSRVAFSASRIGLVITAGLAGLALATAAVSLFADQLGRRRVLVGISVLGALGGLGLALTTQFPGVLLLAFLGLVNGIGTDRGPAFSLDQALIPQTTRSHRRTWPLSWHSLIMDIGHALGALIAGLPWLLARWFGFDLLASYRITFALYVIVNLLSALAYASLTGEIEATAQSMARPQRVHLSPQSRTVITKMATLFGIDSLGGGFLTDALLAYWFLHRFGLTESSLGLLFGVGNILNSFSYLLAARLAERIGLLNTMVFTHIPSSLLLMAVPLAHSPGWAIMFYLAWESLVEMDVPTRQSYVMAIVRPSDRTFASGTTNLARNVARSISPSFAGFLMQKVALATPLFLGGAIKIAYDVLLYSAFRHLKPPEEREAKVTPAGPGITMAGPSN